MVGIYWLNSRSRGGTYHDPRTRIEYLRKVEQDRTEAEIRQREAELRRHRLGWRRR